MSGDEEVEQQVKRKRMSCGLEVECPSDLTAFLHNSSQIGYHFIVVSIVHPNYSRDLTKENDQPRVIGRTDRMLYASDWCRLIVGKVTTTIDVDSESESYQMYSRKLLEQELGFANHLGLPAIMLTLRKRRNVMLGHMLYNRFMNYCNSQIWITMPMVHATNFSPLCSPDEAEDTWDWWNDLRQLCHFNKHLCLSLEIPESKNIPSAEVINRWIGEPVKALIIPTTFFLTNNRKQPVLSKSHQELIQRFMTIDVQYIIKGPPLHGECHKPYNDYINFLGRKLFCGDTMTAFSQGCEDFLQNPLQPLSDHLETMIYDVFEKDQVKYIYYQNAIQKALEDLPKDTTPVVMVVGAGRGPLVQAALNASYILRRKIQLYAVEKNPYAINTLQHRVKTEWFDRVTLVHEDMRTYNPPEKADILVSELLGSFGDNELSPECLDGAQRFLKKTGISIPCSYTSYLAPMMSSKLFNEVKHHRTNEDSRQNVFETPYVIRIVNNYIIDEAKSLFIFEHPNWSEKINNERFKELQFRSPQNCVLTGFAGYFETVLYKDVMLSTNPNTHTKDMVSWFPIVFPLQEPIQLKKNDNIKVAFWRSESADKVWYEWCVQSPMQGAIMNPNGRSYSIKKHISK